MFYSHTWRRSLVYCARCADARPSHPFTVYIVNRINISFSSCWPFYAGLFTLNTIRTTLFALPEVSLESGSL